MPSSSSSSPSWPCARCLPTRACAAGAFACTPYLLGAHLVLVVARHALCFGRLSAHIAHIRYIRAQGKSASPPLVLLTAPHLTASTTEVPHRYGIASGPRTRSGFGTFVHFGPSQQMRSLTGLEVSIDFSSATFQAQLAEVFKVCGGHSSVATYRGGCEPCAGLLALP